MMRCPLQLSENFLMTAGARLRFGGRDQQFRIRRMNLMAAHTSEVLAFVNGAMPQRDVSLIVAIQTDLIL